MRFVTILVEGTTEEIFVKRILKPHLNTLEIEPLVIIVTTKRVKCGQDFRGGITSYDRLKNDLLRLLKRRSAIAVSTMIDFYGLPTDFPGKSMITIGDNPYTKIRKVESGFYDDIRDPRFIPYLQLHEFEALLFSQIDEIIRPFAAENSAYFRRLKSNFENILRQFSGPEEINDNPNSCPSRRITNNISRYHKTIYGPIIAQHIGLEIIRNRCPHFNEWLLKLESLAT
jgi:hypothetical protein